MKHDRTDMYRKLLAFLDSIAEQYPTGVPSTLAIAKSHKKKLWFFLREEELTEEASKLLERAVVQGMNWSADRLECISYRDLSAVSKAIASHDTFLIMGQASLDVLSSCDMLESIKGLVSVIVTESVHDILTDKAKKRSFWEVLQTLI